MAISEFPTPIKDSLSQFGDLALNSRSPIELRGANFKNSTYLYSNSNTNKQWLWKRSNDTLIVREYIASYIASKLGINVPRTLLAQKGTQIGLLYEWLEESIELRESTRKLLSKCPPKEVIQLLLLEAWIGASDRHSGNYLIAKNKIWAIDLEKSFNTDPLDSELALYFDWLNESQLIFKQKAIGFKKQIRDHQILQSKSDVLNTIESLTIDPRAKLALKKQVEDIFSLLLTNFLELTSRIEEYFQKPENSSLFQ